MNHHVSSILVGWSSPSVILPKSALLLVATLWSPMIGAQQLSGPESGDETIERLVNSTVVFLSDTDPAYH